MRTVYFDGSILTMETCEHSVQMLVTNGDLIEYVGAYDEKIKSECDSAVDLKGACLMPGFVDGHSHFMSVASSLMQVSLKEATSFEHIGELLKKYISQNKIPKGQWVNAVGYDLEMLCENSHPTRKSIDMACPDNPVVLQHISGHMGVFNSMGIRLLGIEDKAPVIEGGSIDLENGLFKENAFMKYLKMLPAPKLDALLEAFLKAQTLYASYGITTVQEGMLVKEMLPLYRAFINSGRLKLDIVAYADAQEADMLYSELCDKKYQHFRLGGVKIFLDGSPQSCTALMTRPYLTTGDCGMSTMTDESVIHSVKNAVLSDRQILAHCNGDGACGQFVRAVKSVNEICSVKDIRPVMVHGQFVTEKQLCEAGQLNMLASFFPSHIYYWGETHIKNLGLSRAEFINPLKKASECGVSFTIHTDSPVIPPNMLEAVSCAVNRTTRDGRVLGEDQKIDVYKALCAITKEGAYQYFEEDSKGVIAVGKKADLVILDKNPLTIEKSRIKNIKVLKTIKDGETVFSADFSE